jgi:endogenous inhibitor of DNA gyrase (YacG/DUF329 family)
MVAQAENNSKSKCPICNELTDAEVTTFPFCSDRCRKIDLGKWLDGKYTISRSIEESDLEEGG